MTRFFMLNTFVVIAGLVASSFDDAPASLRLIKDFRGFGSLDPRTTRSLLDNNFESGSMSPWYDESPAYVTWRVEDIQTPTEADYPAPYPLSGFKYVRATRNADLLSGLAVLRSPLFTALPGDRITFDFWMRSKRPEGNSLELVWIVGRNETVVTTLTSYSSSSNLEWRTISVDIPVNSPMEGALVFYGYCGFNLEDAIAIDNILIDYVPSPSTTMSPGSDGECEVFNLTSEGVSITTPNYPENYPDEVKACWIFRANSYYYCTLEIGTFSTESSFDKLNIYGGFNTTSDQYRLDSLHGQYSSTTRSYSGYNAYTLVFTSDSSTSYSGFKIRVFGQ